MTMKKNLTSRADDYAEWYQDVIEAADLAEHSPVRGFMVIKPYGYGIWENIQKVLDAKIKETGHVNAYFPLLIPKSFIAREAEHVEGFAKESAVVTHHRLVSDPKEGLVVDPEAKLDEELIIRPTSETIIYSMFSRWIQSWRDLPMLINQWANIVRWEMRTRLFLRTSEFLWQEGHTAHTTEEEAEEEALKMLGVYKDLAENYLAIPVVSGRKSESEKFAGALRTYTIEAMMQDGKALQAGTSHNLGQNFAKPFEVKFLDKDNEQKYVWQTSWGVSTRLIGALVMAHGDNLGLVLPPKMAPIKIVIVPIWKDDSEKEKVLEHAQELRGRLQVLDGNVKVDDRDYLTPGAKFNEWEKKGVPIRVEIGPKDIANHEVVMVRRDKGEKKVISMHNLVEILEDELDIMQSDLLNRAREFMAEHSYEVDDYEKFKSIIEEKPGFVYAHWCGSDQCEREISDETKATIRCIPLSQASEQGKCIKCGAASGQRVVFAKAY